jgi:quercetin dioxygenase-like cupin family protein
MNTLAKLIIPVVIAGAVLVSACGGSDSKAKPAATDPGAGFTEVVRQVLQNQPSDVVPGQDLGLSRVIIPAGQSIAAHTHPGAQLAVVEAGTLTYTVLKGQVQVTRAAGTAQAKTEAVTAGQTADIQPGDSIVETPGMVHTAKNAKDTAVVIYLTSLFPSGAAASSPATP